MSKLPLYETPADPDARHRVIAPGGYEWWHFRAADPNGLTIEIEFFDGNPFNPEYRRAFEHFRRRPTRNTPPVPRNYPAVRLTQFANGKQLSQVEANLPPNSVQESADRIRVSVGPHSFEIDSNGIFRLNLQPISQQREKPGCHVDLKFVPQKPLQSRDWKIESTGLSISHFQLLGKPKYEVSGTIQIHRGVCIPFTGTGEHPHRFGTGPLADRTQPR